MARKRKGPRDGYSVGNGHGGMKRNRHGDDATMVEKAGSALGKVLTLGTAAYAAKKIGGGLSDIGEGLKED